MITFRYSVPLIRQWRHLLSTSFIGICILFATTAVLAQDAKSSGEAVREARQATALRDAKRRTLSYIEQGSGTLAATVNSLRDATDNEALGDPSLPLRLQSAQALMSEDPEALRRYLSTVQSFRLSGSSATHRYRVFGTMICQALGSLKLGAAEQIARAFAESDPESRYARKLLVSVLNLSGQFDESAKTLYSLLSEAGQQFAWSYSYESGSMTGVGESDDPATFQTSALSLSYLPIPQVRRFKRTVSSDRDQSVWHIDGDLLELEDWCVRAADKDFAVSELPTPGDGQNRAFAYLKSRLELETLLRHAGEDQYDALRQKVDEAIRFLSSDKDLATSDEVARENSLAAYLLLRTSQVVDDWETRCSRLDLFLNSLEGMIYSSGVDQRYRGIEMISGLNHLLLGMLRQAPSEYRLRIITATRNLAHFEAAGLISENIWPVIHILDAAAGNGGAEHARSVASYYWGESPLEHTAALLTADYLPAEGDLRVQLKSLCEAQTWARGPAHIDIGGNHQVRNRLTSWALDATSIGGAVRSRTKYRSTTRDVVTGGPARVTFRVFPDMSVAIRSVARQLVESADRERLSDLEIEYWANVEQSLRSFQSLRNEANETMAAFGRVQQYALVINTIDSQLAAYLAVLEALLSHPSTPALEARDMSALRPPISLERALTTATRALAGEDPAAALEELIAASTSLSQASMTPQEALCASILLAAWQARTGAERWEDEHPAEKLRKAFFSTQWVIGAWAMNQLSGDLAQASTNSPTAQLFRRSALRWLHLRELSLCTQPAFIDGGSSHEYQRAEPLADAGYPWTFAAHVEASNPLLRTMRRDELRDYPLPADEALFDAESVNNHAWMRHRSYVNPASIVRMMKLALVVHQAPPALHRDPPTGRTTQITGMSGFYDPVSFGVVDFAALGRHLDTLAWGVYQTGDREAAMKTERFALELCPGSFEYTRVIAAFEEGVNVPKAN